MAWIIILIAALFVLGGVLTAVRRSVSRPPFSGTVPAPRSYFGVDGFEDATGGVTFDNVEPPGSRQIKPAWSVVTSLRVSMARGHG